MSREPMRNDLVADAAQLAGQFLGLALRVDLRLQHDELVAAEARDRIAVAQHRTQPAGNRHQHRVAHMMAVVVVDRFEVIDIDVVRGERAAVTPGGEQSLFEAILQQRAVRQTREHVAECERVQVLGAIALLDGRTDQTGERAHVVAIDCRQCVAPAPCRTKATAP